MTTSTSKSSTKSTSSSTKDHQDVNSGELNGTSLAVTTGTGSWTKEKASLEKELENLNQFLTTLNSKARLTNSALAFIKPEMEVQLIEKKSICLLKLKKYDEVVEDGYRIIGKRGPTPIVCKCVIAALCHMGKYNDVREVVSQWGKLSPKDVMMQDCKGKVERFLSAVRSGMNPIEVFQTLEQALGLSTEWIYKKNVIVGKDNSWQFRPPPRFANTFFMCSRGGPDTCIYGECCIGAHSPGELAEWKLRQEIRNKNWESARSTVKPNSSLQYLIDVTKRINETTNIRSLLADDLANVKFRCAQPLKIISHQREKDTKWSMLIVSKVPVRTIALLHDVHRNNFWISSAYFHSASCKTDINLFVIHEVNRTPRLQVANTFVPSHIFLGQLGGWPDWFYYKIELTFFSLIYGSFRQTIMFDFKTDPKLVKHLSVELIPEEVPIPPPTDTFNFESLADENCLKIVPSTHQINLGNFEVVDADAGLYVKNSLIALPPPSKSPSVTASNSNCNSKSESPTNSLLSGTEEIRRDNYIAAMEGFIQMEQKARQEELSKYNVTGNLELTQTYTIERDYESLLKCSWQGQLYAKLNLGKEISEDTKIGRLIIRSCENVLLLEAPSNTLIVSKPRGYVCKIADKMKSSIIISVGPKAVQELNLESGTSRNFVVQFLLDERTFKEMRTVLESISDTQLDILFPDFSHQVDFSKHKSCITGVFFEGDFTLNERQLDAYNAVTSLEQQIMPPLLLIGPFGTGKTYALAQCLKKLLGTTAGANNPVRILVCTHSNSAADLYILNYLHLWLEEGMRSARPLRIYYADRLVQTVPHIVKKYCLMTGDGMNFRYPTKEEVLDHQIIIVTLSTSTELLDLGLQQDTFTHILLDEAAQALETEAIQPLMLAGPHTRIVLAGDHMQLSPELFSSFSQSRGISLLERLHHMYPKAHPCRIVLTENYRSHEVILRFASESFYGAQLRCASLQPWHPVWYPITLFAVRGEDVLPENGSSFYNMAEVFEISERIAELVKTWPENWGNYKADNAIAVLTPYAEQVTRIRTQLRSRNLGFVSVERVFNVQGKQFRAVFVSTVRTQKLWVKIDESVDLGFLSNPKLLNTAMTRAQSLFAVIGDPVSLCSMGKCRSLWGELVEISAVNNSFFGMNHLELKQQLLGLEMRATFGYNPLATAYVHPTSLAQPSTTTTTAISQGQTEVIQNQSQPAITSSPSSSLPLYLKGSLPQQSQQPLFTTSAMSTYPQTTATISSQESNNIPSSTSISSLGRSFQNQLQMTPNDLDEESVDEKQMAEVIDKLLFPEVASIWSNGNSSTNSTGNGSNKHNSENNGNSLDAGLQSATTLSNGGMLSLSKNSTKNIWAPLASAIPEPSYCLEPLISSELNPVNPLVSTTNKFNLDNNYTTSNGFQFPGRSVSGPGHFQSDSKDSANTTTTISNTLTSTSSTVSAFDLSLNELNLNTQQQLPHHALQSQSSFLPKESLLNNFMNSSPQQQQQHQLTNFNNSTSSSFQLGFTHSHQHPTYQHHNHQLSRFPNHPQDLLNFGGSGVATATSNNMSVLNNANATFGSMSNLGLGLGGAMNNGFGNSFGKEHVNLSMDPFLGNSSLGKFNYSPAHPNHSFQQSLNSNRHVPSPVLGTVQHHQQMYPALLQNQIQQQQQQLLRQTLRNTGGTHSVSAVIGTPTPRYQHQALFTPAANFTSNNNGNQNSVQPNISNNHNSGYNTTVGSLNNTGNSLLYGQAIIRNASPAMSISSSETLDCVSSSEFPTLSESASAKLDKHKQQLLLQQQQQKLSTQQQGSKAQSNNHNQNNQKTNKNSNNGVSHTNGNSSSSGGGVSNHINHSDEWVQVKKKKNKVKDATPIPSGEEKIELLISMGFEKKEAIRALQRTNRNLDEAVEWLLNKSSPQGNVEH